MMPNLLHLTAHIVSVIDTNRLCIRVHKEYLDPLLSEMSRLDEKVVVKDIFTLNVRDCRFEIKNFEWKELYDLVGLEVKITVGFKRYNFQRRGSMMDTDAEGNLIEKTVPIKCRGVSIIGRRVSNCL